MNFECAEGATAQATQKAFFNFRAPVAKDGPDVARLIAACPPLDANSLYCNLLQCSHFADTSILAEADGGLCGWVSGYQVPGELEALFVWQVAVHEAARGQGLAKALIGKLLERLAARGVNRMKTTITPDNDMSWALFRSLAADLNAPFKDETWFKRNIHFDGAHPTEHLVAIGPFGTVPGP